LGVKPEPTTSSLLREGEAEKKGGELGGKVLPARKQQNSRPRRAKTLDKKQREGKKKEMRRAGGLPFFVGWG